MDLQRSEGYTHGDDEMRSPWTIQHLLGRLHGLEGSLANRWILWCDSVDMATGPWQLNCTLCSVSAQGTLQNLHIRCKHMSCDPRNASRHPHRNALLICGIHTRQHFVCFMCGWCVYMCCGYKAPTFSMIMKCNPIIGRKHMFCFVYLIIFWIFRTFALSRDNLADWRLDYVGAQ